ncbi:MAG: lipase maturation factor family protein [Myxococcota bacterium]|nr:lipase maturation factor family protein [Myxococcota bacterium]
MSPLLIYDAQSVLASWVAQRLSAAAAGRLELAAAQDHDGPAVDRELRLRIPEGTEWRDLDALLHAAALIEGGGAALERDQRSAFWRRVHRLGYRWATENRVPALAVAKRLWNADPTTYLRSRWLFLRLLGLSFLFAFVSLGVQVRGLFGAQGIVPLQLMLEGAGGGRVYLAVPSLLWFSASDPVLVGCCGVGALASLLLMAGVAQRAALAVMGLLYLSLVALGAPFLSFQWDTLLLEAGFLSLFLAPAGLWNPRPAAATGWAARLLLKWLLFRVMFLSGLVKLTSGDASWRQFTAMDFHLWTQPLPSVGAWWMAHHAAVTLRAQTALTLVIELVFPFLLFGHHPLRRIGVMGMLALLGGIAATGSYGFLGLLTASLCLLVIDDQDLRWLDRWVPVGTLGARSRSRLRWVGGGLILGWVFTATVAASWARATRSWEPVPTPLRVAHALTSPLMIANGYGMFEVMTRDRLELSVEGSEDGQTWRPYRFRYKPGAPEQAPRYAAPHMPRLDWMMWFAALGRCEDSPWLFSLQKALLEGSPPVEGLFESVPFEGRPPRRTRIQAARYRFAPRGSQAFWTVEPLGAFCPEVALQDGRLVRAELRE